MPLTFHPIPGVIVICDFSTGFRAPEMVKKRPVVIISPRRRMGQLVTVVPLSSSEPKPVEPWHWPVPDGIYPPARGPMWGKADIVQTVGLDRLDRIMVRQRDGTRAYHVYQLTELQLSSLRFAVRAGLGLAP